MNRAKVRKGPMIRLRSKNMNSDIANWPLFTTVMWLCFVNSREFVRLHSRQRTVLCRSRPQVLCVYSHIHAYALTYMHALQMHTEKKSRILGVPVKPGLRSTRTRARALDIKYRTIETTIIGNHSLIKTLLMQKD